MEFFDNLLDRLVQFGENLIEWLILLAIALVVLIVGRWIIGLIRKFFEKLLGASFLDGVWERSGVAKALAEGDQTPASLVATLIYAYLMLALLVVVADILLLTTIEVLLLRLLAWLPILLVAAFIVIVAAAIAHWVAELIKPFADENNVPWLTWVVRVAIIIFGILFAMDLLRVDFAEDIVTIAIGALTVGLAIAFGVGGIDAGKAWWAKYGMPRSGGGGGGSGTPPQN